MKKYALMSWMLTKMHPQFQVIEIRLATGEKPTIDQFQGLLDAGCKCPVAKWNPGTRQGDVTVHVYRESSATAVNEWFEKNVQGFEEVYPLIHSFCKQDITGPEDFQIKKMEAMKNAEPGFEDVQGLVIERF